MVKHCENVPSSRVVTYTNEPTDASSSFGVGKIPTPLILDNWRLLPLTKDVYRLTNDLLTTPSPMYHLTYSRYRYHLLSVLVLMHVEQFSSFILPRHVTEIENTIKNLDSDCESLSFKLNSHTACHVCFRQEC